MQVQIQLHFRNPDSSTLLMGCEFDIVIVDAVLLHDLRLLGDRSRVCAVFTRAKKAVSILSGIFGALFESPPKRKEVTYYGAERKGVVVTPHSCLRSK